MANDFVLAGEGAIFVQPDGPNTKPQYLGCHQIGDIAEPKGDVKLMYNPDPSAPNKWEVVGSYQAAPGAVTTSITADVKRTADYLEKLRCLGTLFVHHINCGRLDQFNGWDRTFILTSVSCTSRKLSKLQAKDPSAQDRAQQSFDLTAQQLLALYQLTGARQDTVETMALSCIASLDRESCEGNCGVSSQPGDVLFAGTDVPGGSPTTKADVLYSTDGGATWNICSAQPFAAGEKIAAIKTFLIDASTPRVVVVCGTTGVSNPTKLAYSDDYGATWTSVSVGSLNGQYATGPGALFVFDYYHCFLVTTGGYTYISGDGCASWTAQETGVTTSQNLACVSFSDDERGFAAGANNAIIKTTDGGDSWSLVTGPSGQSANNIVAIVAHDKYRVWLAYNNGKLFYTHDGGTTWTERTFPGSGTGAIKDMSWYNQHVGFITHNNGSGAGTIYETVDGGYTWRAVTTPTNLGLNGLVAATGNLAFAAGAVVSGTAMIIKFAPD